MEISLSLSLYLGGSGFGGVARRGEERSGAEMAGVSSCREAVVLSCDERMPPLLLLVPFLLVAKPVGTLHLRERGFCIIALEGIGFFRQLQRLLPHFL